MQAVVRSIKLVYTFILINNEFITGFLFKCLKTEHVVENKINWYNS